MKIAIIITRADAVGGATVHVRDLACGLRDRGHQIVVLVGGEGEVTDEFTKHGIPYQSLKWLGRAIHPLNDFLALLELRRVLQRRKPDLVCAHTAKAGLLGRLAAFMAGIPALYTPHGWSIGGRISATHSWIYRMLERSVGPLSARIINVCNAERELARQHRIAGDAKLAVVYNGVIDVDAGLLAQPAQTPPHILMVARFEQPKDHATLLAAVALVQDLPWTMEFVGGGPQRAAVLAQAHAMGLGTRIHFTGSGADVASRLSQSQIFVLSSRSEGFPLSILEAMRAGLPVVASDVGGVREAVLSGETGWVVPGGDACALADALRLLLEDGALRETFGAAARRRYELYFTFDRMLTQTLALYDSVLSLSRGETSVLREASRGR